MKKIIPVILALLLSPALYAVVATSTPEANAPVVDDNGANVNNGAAADQGDEPNANDPNVNENAVPPAEPENPDSSNQPIDVNQDNNSNQ